MGIVIGGIFAFLGVRKGFYDTWAILFDIVIAVYLGVFLGPAIAAITPEALPGYHSAMTIGATGLAAFAILYGISYIFITNQYKVPFPRALDILGAGFLGFLAGVLVWSFASTVVCLTPLTEKAVFKTLGFQAAVDQASVSYLAGWCDGVHSIVGSDKDEDTKAIIAGLIKSAEKEKAIPTADDVNDTTEASEPNAP